jgi:hypothetical protein
MMLLATPIVGGHYFVDIFAGIAIAAASIAVAKHLGARADVTTSQHEPSPTAAASAS